MPLSSWRGTRLRFATSVWPVAVAVLALVMMETALAKVPVTVPVRRMTPSVALARRMAPSVVTAFVLE